MKKLTLPYRSYSKKLSNLRSRRKLYGSSTPKFAPVLNAICHSTKVAESELAYELQRERSPGEEKISGVQEALPERADIAR